MAETVRTTTAIDEVLQDAVDRDVVPGVVAMAAREEGTIYEGAAGVREAGRPDPITPDTPLRLSVAAALAYPDGSMTASGLRREARRGRLAFERTAGKDYTTLANIERMRQLCRVEAKVPGCGSGQPVGKAVGSSRVPSGSSSMANSISPQDALRTKLMSRKSG